MAIDLSRLDQLWDEFVNENRFDEDFDPNSEAAKFQFFGSKVPEAMPGVRRASQSGTPGLTTAQQFGTGYEITPSEKWGDLVTMGDPSTVYMAPRENEFAKFLKAAGLAFGAGAGLTGLLGAFGPAAGLAETGAAAGAGIGTAAEGGLYSLAAPGTGIGGVGTAGVGLTTTGAGSAGLTLGGLGPAAAGASFLPEATLASMFPAAYGLPYGLPGPPMPPGTQPGAPVQEGPTVPPGGPPGVGSGTTGLPIPAGATTAAGTALSRILGGNAKPEDWLSVLGTAGATGLGMYQSGQQANALTDIANQQIQLRAPFLSKATGYLNDPSSFYGSTEGGAAMEAILRRLSPGGGVSDDYRKSLATGALYDRYAGTIGMLGNLGLSGQTNVTAPQMAAAGTSGGALTTLAGGLSDILNPKPQQMTLADLMKQFNLTVGGVQV